MLKHWLIDLIGHVSGLSDAQLRQIEKSLPASKALIDLLNRAEPIIEQAQKLYVEAEPLIDEAMKEWQTVGPAAQILIDVIGHHVNKGSSPAEAAEAVRTALNSSIESVAQNHWIDQRMSCVTVFGGTGFVGRRVVRYLCESGATVRVASRHPRRAEGDDVKQIAADAHDERSVEAAVAGADGVVNAISLYVEHGSDTFHSAHVETAARIASVARRVGAKRLVHLSGIGADAASPSPYIRSRGEGEAAVQAACPGGVIIRPAVMFGAADGFRTTIHSVLRVLRAFSCSAFRRDRSKKNSKRCSSKANEETQQNCDRTSRKKWCRPTSDRTGRCPSWVSKGHRELQILWVAALGRAPMTKPAKLPRLHFPWRCRGRRSSPRRKRSWPAQAEAVRQGSVARRRWPQGAPRH